MYKSLKSHTIDTTKNLSSTYNSKLQLLPWWSLNCFGLMSGIREYFSTNTDCTTIRSSLGECSHVHFKFSNFKFYLIINIHHISFNHIPSNRTITLSYLLPKKRTWSYLFISLILSLNRNGKIPTKQYMQRESMLAICQFD